MKSMIIAAATALALAGAAAPMTAHAADEGLMASGGLSFFSIDAVDLSGVTGRLTFVANEHFGVEGEMSLGFGEDEVGAADVELERAIGIFAIGFLPIDNQFDLFGRIGFTDVEIESSVGPFGAQSSADGVGYGFGALYQVSSRIGVRAEYSQFAGEGEDIDVLAVSGVYKF